MVLSETSDKTLVLNILQDGRKLKHKMIRYNFGNDKEVILKAVSSYPKGLRYASEELCKDKDILMTAFLKDPRSIMYALKLDYFDKELLLKCDKIGSIYRYIDKPLKKDKELFEVAVKKNPRVIEYADISIKDDKDIGLQVVKKNGLLLKFLSSNLREDEEIVIISCDNNPRAFEFAGKEIKHNEDFILKLAEKYESEIYPFFPYKIYKFNDPFFLKCFQKNPNYFKHLSEDYNNNPEYARIAMKFNRSLYKFIGWELSNDKEFLLDTIKNITGLALGKASNEAIQDRNFLKEAMKYKETSLSFLPSKYSSDKELAKIAIERDPEQIRYVTGDLKTDKELALISVRKNGYFLQFIQRDIIDFEIALEAVKSYGYAIQWLGKYKNDLEIAYEAVKSSRMAYHYLPNLIQENKRIFMTFHRRFSLENERLQSLEGIYFHFQ